MTTPPPLAPLLDQALERRAGLLNGLHAQSTNCYRLFHGAVEGRPGLTLDRYGPQLLAQSFREPLQASDLGALTELAARLDLPLCWNHRGSDAPFDTHSPLDPALVEPAVTLEDGLKYRVQARHRGRDPLLFLDTRAARRWLRGNSRGLEVLNLFAYTCSLGVAAAAGGARKVLNVDFAASSLEVGKQNAILNGLGKKRFRSSQADVIPTLRQLSGKKVKGKGAIGRQVKQFQAATFDVVVLDPPTWAKSPFGAVDIVRDYPSLLKPSLLCTRPGGVVLAMNHVSMVHWDDWIDVCTRCAAKAGRPLQSVERIWPDPDFPSPDGSPPLKMALLRV